MRSLTILGLSVIFVAEAALACEEEQKGLEVVIERVDRVGRLLEVWARVVNRGQVPVILEKTARGDAWVLHSLKVEQRERAGRWISVGPIGDQPPKSVIELKPGQSLSTMVPLVDPFPFPKKGNPVRIRGPLRAKLPYFATEEEWRAYRAAVNLAVRTMGKLPKDPPVAVSEPFEIPPNK